MKETKTKPNRSEISFSSCLAAFLIFLNLCPPYQAADPKHFLLPLLAIVLLDALSALRSRERLGAGPTILAFALGFPSLGAAWLLSSLLSVRLVVLRVFFAFQRDTMLRACRAALPVLTAVTTARFVPEPWTLAAAGGTFLLSQIFLQGQRERLTVLLRRCSEVVLWFIFLLWCSGFGPWQLFGATLAVLLVFFEQDRDPERLERSFSRQIHTTERTLKNRELSFQQDKERFEDQLHWQDLLDRFQGEALQSESLKELAKTVVDFFSKSEENGQVAVVEKDSAGLISLAQSYAFQLEVFQPLPKSCTPGQMVHSACGARRVFALDRALLFLHQGLWQAEAERDRFNLQLLARAALIARILQQKHELARLLEEKSSALQRLAESQAQLVQSEKLAAIGQLAAGVAHEINSPLAAIQLQTQLARRRLQKQDWEGVLKSVNTVQDASENATHIIKGLLVYSRLSDGARTEVSLAVLIGQVGRMLQAHLASAHIDYSEDLAELPDIMACPQEISQIITNIVLNAVDALKEKATEGKIVVSSRQHGDFQQVIVSNNGPLLTPEISSRLFEPFFTTKTVGSGTGLGLSIAHQLAASHQGDLKAENHLGWVRFTLSLPSQRVEQLQERQSGADDRDAGQQARKNQE